MVMGAAIAGDGSQGSRKETKCQAQESRMQMCVQKRRGAAASGKGKSVKVADLCDACFYAKLFTLSNSAEIEKKPKGRLHQAPSSRTL
jgi:hypothetical protein